jgi:hypothetical protein
MPMIKLGEDSPREMGLDPEIEGSPRGWRARRGDGGLAAGMEG